MTKAKEAKFILLYGITSEEYYKKEIEIFNATYNSNFATVNNAIKEYAQNRLRQALLKIEEV